MIRFKTHSEKKIFKQQKRTEYLHRPLDSLHTTSLLNDRKETETYFCVALHVNYIFRSGFRRCVKKKKSMSTNKSSLAIFRDGRWQEKELSSLWATVFILNYDFCGRLDVEKESFEFLRQDLSNFFISLKATKDSNRRTEVERTWSDYGQECEQFLKFERKKLNWL